ncbi:HepT-like ribonuclease domain-containing protein [Microbacterium sp. WCS2018Hpa-23]|uniref:HepT-like ribonuclease domain-containing protein n=1 Tax=Microbacterium sp. WCS2018Hpa-23 TaxID=3073634 RepID=UPI002882F5BC|nr:HepT-like ribonuclease domain-containing protein [Microbacterium sp. WCS2018Hpa-23]
MSRHTSERLEDIASACDAVARYERRIDSDDEIVFDAIRARLIEIGEAVKGLSEAATAAEPGIPWAEIAGMRDYLAHRYFDTTHAIVMTTARSDVPLLAAAVQRMRSRERDASTKR